MTRDSRCKLILAFVFIAIMFSSSAIPVFAQVPDGDMYEDFRWRNIGPANMSGRISDIEALDDDFTHVIVATASGGVWKSVNAGITWEQIFADYETASIGDIAIFQPNPDIIWIGTGEECGRNSVGWGNGIYKSTDGGKTFTNMGLEDTHVIATVLTHPTNPDIVYVGATGHLWGYSGDRGLYKTTDGGETWEKLSIGSTDDGKTGVGDLVMDPNNANTLYVGMWERMRQPFRFDSGGPNGGIFKTTNGGGSWTKLSNGLPDGNTGKIGLTIYKKNPNIVMAIVEADRTGDLSVPGSGIYRTENGGRNWEFVNTSNSRPFYYSHIYLNPNDDQIVYMLTSGFEISYDGGKTFEKQSTRTHGDYHALWIDPVNSDRFYFGNDGGASLTLDHGESYEFFDNIIASQFYAIGADMRDPYWVFGGLQDNGTWGGPSKVRDPNGILTDHWIKIGGGDGFHAQIDPTDWRTVYAESQAGNISRKNIEEGTSTGIRPNQNNILNYDEYITDAILRAQAEKGFTAGRGGGGRGGRGGQQTQPQGNPFRFNWSAPIVMSPHNSQILYFGGNHLFKTVDKGNSWQIISPDLSRNDPVNTRRETGGITPDITGAETYGSIITISESPLTPGLIWVGTDDGNVQLTRNNGLNWSNIRFNIPGVPQDLWISRVEASHFEEGTAYLTFDGHRSDNFTPWVFKTEDYGQKWTNISSNIPDGNSIYVIKEDLKNPDLLFVGTEFGCFITLNGGNSWEKFMNNMPTVAIHDLVIHPRDGDLIAASHGRGVFILDDLTALQQMTEETRSSNAALFEQRTFTKWKRIQKNDPRKGFQYFAGENYNSSEAPISYYLGTPPRGDVLLEIVDLQGRKHTAILDDEEGVHKYMWNMQYDPPQMTNQQIQGTENRLLQTIELAEVEEEKQLLRERLADYQRAPTDAHRRKALRGVELANLGGRGFGGRGEGRGGGGTISAGFGIFLVKMTVDGETYTSSITLREDPIVAGK